jgi:hypothetical protein
MFESAIEAAATAASTWTPERADPTGGLQCCPLCLHRYRRLVLEGPLRQLPHGVAHAAAVVVDDLITERLESRLEQLRGDVRAAPGSEEDREAESSRRMRAAAGALTMVAVEEFAAAEHRIGELRCSYTDPAVAAYLARQQMNEVPWQWEL